MAWGVFLVALQRGYRVVRFSSGYGSHGLRRVVWRSPLRGARHKAPLRYREIDCGARNTRWNALEAVAPTDGRLRSRATWMGEGEGSGDADLRNRVYDYDQVIAWA